MNEINDDMKMLAEDTGDILESATDTARKGLASVLDHGRDIYGSACRRARRETTIADGFLHDNLYQTVLVGMGIGAVIGYLFARGTD